MDWQIIFWITAAVYAFGIVFFWFTVSGVKQPWAENSEETESNPQPSITTYTENEQNKVEQ